MPNIYDPWDAVDDAIDNGTSAQDAQQKAWEEAVKEADSQDEQIEGFRYDD